jgi:hypothetical protein
MATLASFKGCANWVAWMNAIRNGAPTKTPFDAKTGNMAKTDDPSTWSDYGTATKCKPNAFLTKASTNRAMRTPTSVPEPPKMTPPRTTAVMTWSSSPMAVSERRSRDRR